MPRWAMLVIGLGISALVLAAGGLFYLADQEMNPDPVYRTYDWCDEEGPEDGDDAEECGGPFAFSPVGD